MNTGKRRDIWKGFWKGKVFYKIFKISSIPKLNPSTCFLINTNKEVIQCKFYQHELQLVRENLLCKMLSRRFEDEFTVHVIFASVEIFYQNTLASFWIFFNDEIQLSGDWRVVLGEIIFPTKIEHITNGVLTSYSLSCLEDHQRNSSGANVLSRP